LLVPPCDITVLVLFCFCYLSKYPSI